MLASHGGRFSGRGLYVNNGRPVFDYNFAGVERYEGSASDKLSAGKHDLRLEFAYDGGGISKGGMANACR